WGKFIDSTQSEIELADYLNKLPRLGEHSYISGSATVKEAYELKAFIKEANFSESHKNYKKVINSGTIDKYVSLWGIKKLNYLGSKILHPSIENKNVIKINKRRYEQSESNKIIIAGMTRDLEC